ncbi:MAG TPA: glycoside hydrolase family 38 C-terminal domain-containing protein [Chthoniobacteraceae bacterium]|nr:glycoside hydrolase family 38 C-terminal domain-containing protein [Chthoniobacteraceae bacterium]
MKLHLIPNSHLDPVWLWDWREGLNEGVTTCRTILQLMEEFPDLTYIRGESVIYEHIQKADPAIFEQIRNRIDEGRWEVVGGTLLQPDTNLPATETLVRQFTSGLSYFEKNLGRRPRIAWAADSFGHSAGWPEIYTSAGMTGFAFSRPMEHDFHLPKPAFWWEAASGARILCWRIPIGWYGTQRNEIPLRLDQTRSRAAEWGLENVAAFVGLGNHGGGPSRRHLKDIEQWAEANPDVEVIYSGLERFFAALHKETTELPVIRGELNFTLRGCYSSAMQFKARYRKTENLLLSAEKTDSIVSAACETPGSDLSAAWRSVLFNTFHDILPGSSIERAYDDQFAWLGVAWHDAQRAELAALNTLASRIDTSVETPTEDMPCAVPVLVWNPHPFDYEGPVEIEACIDYRPVESYAGRVAELPVQLLDGAGQPLFFQRLEPEHYFSPSIPWRVRMATRVRVPAMGWQVLQIAWAEKPRLAAAPAGGARITADGGIENEYYRVAAQAGEEGVHIFRNGKPVFGEAGLRVAIYDDRYGSWGGHDGEVEADSITDVKEYWRIQRIEPLVSGPEKTSLWLRFASACSRLDLTVTLHRGCDRVEIAARLFWDEPARRIKLVMPAGEEALFEVPGGTQKRRPCGEMPGGRWVRTPSFLFASDSVFNFDLHGGCLNATLVRSARHACSVPTEPAAMPWRPYMDSGEHRFQLALAPAECDAYPLADLLEQPPVTSPLSAHPGKLSKTGSLGRLEPSNLRLLAFKPAEERDGWIVRVQETAGDAADAVFTLKGTDIPLGAVRPHQIASWKLIQGERGWEAELQDSSENPVAEAVVNHRAVPNGKIPDHKNGKLPHLVETQGTALSEKA